MICLPGNMSHVMQGRAFPRLVADLALDRQALFKVAQRCVVVPPRSVDLAEVVEGRAFIASRWGNGESTLQSSQGALGQAQCQLAQTVAAQCPPGRGCRGALHDLLGQGRGSAVIADTVVEATDIPGPRIGKSMLPGLTEVVDGFDIVAPAARDVFPLKMVVVSHSPVQLQQLCGTEAT